MLPCVPAGIGQFQTLAYLFQSDAAAAFVGFALGVVAVGDFATYFMHVLAEIYTDMAGLGGRDAMFESILYEGDEYQRGNLRRAVGLSGRISKRVSTVTLDERRMRIKAM